MFNLDQFVSDRSPTWTELDRLVRDAGGRPSRLGAEGVRRLGECYRATAADLALARRRFPGDALVLRLEQLVARGRPVVYNAPTSRTGVVEFFTTRYWQRVRERPGVLAVSFLCLALPALLGGYWAWRDPGPAERAGTRQVRGGDPTAHAGPEPRAHRRRRVGNGIADLHQQHHGDVLRVLRRAAVRCGHAVRAAAERRDARRRRGARDRIRATAGRSSSSSPRTACSS